MHYYHYYYSVCFQYSHNLDFFLKAICFLPYSHKGFVPPNDETVLKIVSLKPSITSFIFADDILKPHSFSHSATVSFEFVCPFSKCPIAYKQGHPLMSLSSAKHSFTIILNSTGLITLPWGAPFSRFYFLCYGMPSHSHM